MLFVFLFKNLHKVNILHHCKILLSFNYFRV
nr:MAG TPA: hypothetical protein [Caudoviricetes sp.]